MTKGRVKHILGKYKNLTGQKFGRLTVIGKGSKTKSGKITWKCKCDCGNMVCVVTQHLKSGHSLSCGCFNKQRIKEHFTTHGATHTRLYSIWKSMKTRCYNNKSKAYPYYGGKGISVCEEWKNSFQAFQEWALNNGYSDDLTLDRIDSDLGYNPYNCRWATWHEQRINQKRVSRTPGQQDGSPTDGIPTKGHTTIYYNVESPKNQVNTERGL